MKVQLLSFPGCPNVDAARQTLRRTLEACRIQASVEELDVTAASTPEHLRGWGSPTILVDGRDVEGERSPQGTSCRLYQCGSQTSGVPSEGLIRTALDQARPRRWRWLQTLSLLPAALLPFLPKAACPLCLAAYGSVLSALGLGFLVNERVLAPLIGAFLLLGVLSIAWSSRSHGRRGPLVATLVGAAAVVSGRLLWSVPIAVYGGVAVLVAASFWNLWLRRPRPASPIITFHPPRGGASA